MSPPVRLLKTVLLLETLEYCTYQKTWEPEILEVLELGNQKAWDLGSMRAYWPRELEN